MLGPDDLHAYTSAVENELSHLSVPLDALYCDDCFRTEHCTSINAYYTEIIDCLRKASELTISKHLGMKRKRNVPGWNEYVKDSHDLLCDIYSLWALLGKPQDGYIRLQLRLARARFKYALRFCLRHEKELRAKSLAEKLVQNPYSLAAFWKEVRKLNNRPPVAHSVDSISGCENVAGMWKEHFSNILNSVSSTDCKDFVLQQFQEETKTFNCISVPEILKSTHELATGRSNGSDGLSAEHFKHAGVACATHLSVCFSMMVKHSCVPHLFAKVVLTPIVKDRSGKLSEKDNYRPIAMASVSSKILERVILNRSSDQLSTGDHQFGFKEDHSTDMAIYALKEITDYYLRNRSPVFICFLDARKAFDRVNHWKLFAKLLERKVDTHLVRFLCSWYKSQQFHVLWGDVLSEGFSVSNGVRQGGILSPFLFNVYTDELSTLLDKSGIGCHFQGSINHLYYADDMVLLSPSSYGLQKC